MELLCVQNAICNLKLFLDWIHGPVLQQRCRVTGSAFSTDTYEYIWFRLGTRAWSPRYCPRQRVKNKNDKTKTQISVNISGQLNWTFDTGVRFRAAKGHEFFKYFFIFK